ncbi:MAG: hypothetical protein ACK56C_08150, partial [Alphaproteobacteria bacterium]
MTDPLGRITREMWKVGGEKSYVSLFSDDVYLSELLKDAKAEPIDLMIETNGGYTDATEKFVA